jgi:hypothetical protein
MAAEKEKFTDEQLREHLKKRGMKRVSDEDLKLVREIAGTAARACTGDDAHHLAMRAVSESTDPKHAKEIAADLVDQIEASRRPDAIRHLSR